jgi:hypothetical protein
MLSAAAYHLAMLAFHPPSPSPSHTHMLVPCAHRCRDTPLWCVQHGNPRAGWRPLFESESLDWPGFIEFDDDKVLTFCAKTRWALCVCRVVVVGGRGGLCT